MLKSKFFFLVSFLLTLTIYTTITQAGNSTPGQVHVGSNVKAQRTGVGNTGPTNNNGNFVATDPNNIRFVLGKTQLFPKPEDANIMPLKLLSQNITPSHQQSESSFTSSKKSDKIPELGADIGNNGGIHQNNVNIGGIQNFGGDVKAEIARIIADKDNVGGSHQNNVAIGGILNFNGN